jgi:hypothetical protein
MLVFKTILLAYTTLAFASLIWHSANDVKRRGVDVFEDLEARGFDGSDFVALQAWTGVSDFVDICKPLLTLYFILVTTHSLLLA